MAQAKSKRQRARRNQGFSVYQVGHRWKAAVIIGSREDGTPIRKTFTCKTQKEARASAEEFLARLHAVGPAVLNEKGTLREWYGVWKQHLEQNRRPNTVRFYSSIFETHVLPAIGSRKLADITPQMLQALINARTAAGQSGAPMRRALRACFNAARRTGVLARPVAAI